MTYYILYAKEIVHSIVTNKRIAVFKNEISSFLIKNIELF